MFVGSEPSKSPVCSRGRAAHRVAALLAALLLIAAGAWAQDDPAAQPVALSDGTHLWLFETTASPDSRRVLVLHHGPFHDPDTAAQASLTEEMPEAAVAVDARLYCFFRGRLNPDGTFTNRSVSTVRAESWDPRARAWVYEPSPRARTVADLPGGGRVAGVAAEGRDPLVLLAPLPPLGQHDAALQGSGPGAGLPALYRLRPGGWEQVPLPADSSRSSHLVLAPGERPIIFADLDGESAGACTAFTLGEDGEWTSQEADFSASRVISAALHDGQTFLALYDPGARRTDVLLWRNGRAYPIVTGAAATRTARLVSSESTLALADLTADRAGIVLTAIDISKGAMGETREIRRRLAPAFQDFSLLLLVGTMLVAFLLFFILRPGDPARVTVALPAGTQIAEPRRRLAALLIDLLPAAILASLILRVPFLEVFSLARLPMRVDRLEETMPMLLMLLLCAGHCTLSELVWGRTLGKAIMECAVVGIDGKPARPLAILVRNTMKLVALLVPVLFLFVYINQYRQALGDLLGRTVVIAPAGEARPGDAPPDEDR